MSPFVELLRRRSGREPERPALYLRDGTGFAAWTWAELWRRTRVAASGLSAAGVAPGDHVILVAHEVHEAVTGLFGAWAAGAVPIQVGLPFRPGDLQDLLPGLEATARRLDARTIVLPAPLAKRIRTRGTTRLIGTDVLDDASADLDAPRTAPGPALIQLTSGSVGRPRGVVIPAERMMRHLASISRAMPPGKAAVGVSWLPLHHDMGLIGGLLYPLCNGFPVHLLSPADFRSRPYSWLETLSRVGATHTAAPPAAYALVTRLAPRAVSRGLGLGALRCAMVGAEPIPPAVLRGFTRAFAPCGFRPEAVFPVYGLAEATVAVTFPKPLSRPRFDSVDRTALQGRGRALPSDAADALEFTSVGKAIPGTKVRVADDAGMVLQERAVGEIQLRSASAMAGYYGDPAGTGEVLRGGWLRTGDMGYLADGTLYVTGRRKEIIIRAGQNLLPQAVEQVAQSVPGVRQGGTAAVGLRSAARGTERAVLFAETALETRHQRDLITRIARALKARVLEVDEIRLLPPHSLPRTSSGKLRRCELAAMLAPAG